MLIDDAVTTRRTGLSISFSNSTAGADIVDRGIAFHLVHRLADADLGGEVDDAVDPIERARDRIAVAHVGADQLHLGIEGGRPVGRSVDLLDQAVEHTDLMAAREQFVADEAADEARPAGDEYLFHTPPLTIASSDAN